MYSQSSRNKWLPRYFSYFSKKNICCGYSLEGPHWGPSNEYHNICFHGEIRKILVLFSWKKLPYLELHIVNYMYDTKICSMFVKTCFMFIVYKSFSKTQYQMNIFLISAQKHTLWVLPHWDASNEYPQHRFLHWNKKNIHTFGCRVSCLELCLVFDIYVLNYYVCILWL